MDREKLMKMAGSVRTGGKGTMRRKKKALHKPSTTDDKKLQSTLKRIGVNTIPAIEEVNIFKDDLVIQFVNPKVQASIAANTWVISGTPQTRIVLAYLYWCSAKNLTLVLVKRQVIVSFDIVDMKVSNQLQDILPGIINQLDSPLKLSLKYLELNCYENLPEGEVFNLTHYEMIDRAVKASRPDNLDNLRKLAEQFQKEMPAGEAGAAQEDDDDVPDLVAGETFEAAAEEDQK
ncbi:hypothetical protein DKX38_027460 [Salix brachista]|uniref:Nascent polypeptide-associated complex subunit beta n=1 Tax=Salix brachista TaxID=2182728 RepID=A0A5N5JCX2_9ROSI|nr:hypothetical protein DKX38_027460 [Salix brachista]